LNVIVKITVVLFVDEIVDVLVVVGFIVIWNLYNKAIAHFLYSFVLFSVG